MKLKDFKFLAEARKRFHGAAYAEKQAGKYAEAQYTRSLVKEIDEALEKFPKVNVSYLIGSRSYYSRVTKIGKKYFDGTTPMTRGRGYYCIKEIPAITEDMQKSMIADSYYY